MKTRCVFGMVLLCLVAGLAITPGAAPLAAAPTPAIGNPLVVTSISGCFPVDECNICCVQPNGGLICTQRACV